MAINTKKGVEELISYTIVTDKGALVNLLKKSGVKLNASPSDLEVTTAVLVANKKSSLFKSELAKILEKKLPKAGETFMGIVGNSQDFGFTGVDDVTYERGFTGVDDFNDFTGWDDFKNLITINPSVASGITTASQTSKSDLRKMSTAQRKASGQKN